MNVIILDTETTGLLQPSAVPLERQPKIIELGAIYLNKKLKITRTMSQLINPEEKLLEIITKITGIKDEDLISQPTFAEYLPQLKKFFARCNILICHNAPFDVGMLENELERIKCNNFPWPNSIICTIQEYKAKMGKWPKMVDLYQEIMGKPLPQKHRALQDCEALLEILIKDKFFNQLGSVI